MIISEIKGLRVSISKLLRNVYLSLQWCQDISMSSKIARENLEFKHDIMSFRPANSSHYLVLSGTVRLSHHRLVVTKIQRKLYDYWVINSSHPSTYRPMEILAATSFTSTEFHITGLRVQAKLSISYLVALKSFASNCQKLETFATSQHHISLPTWLYNILLWVFSPTSHNQAHIYYQKNKFTIQLLRTNICTCVHLSHAYRFFGPIELDEYAKRSLIGCHLCMSVGLIVATAQSTSRSQLVLISTNN